MRLRRLALPLVASVVGCALSAGAADAQAPSLDPIGTDFETPVFVTAPPGDGRRVMVVEQGGAVRVVRDGVKLDTPFLTLTDDFLTGGERGLLSIAFSPDYETNRLLYAFYTDSDGDIRVDELRRAASSRDRVEPGYRRSVIEVPHREAGNHNGGQVQFGSDGYLYIGTGDGGNGYDEPVRDARDLSSLLGKILRIRPTAGGGYTVPADNPYFGPEIVGPQRHDEIWSYGLRNPFRFSFDRPTGDLFIGDVGQSKVEEVNRAPFVAGVGAGRGFNYGWDDCEGSLQAEPKPTGTSPCTLTGDTLPVLEQPRPASGFCSIIGGYVVRDPGVEALNGRYLYGDLCYSSLRSFDPANPSGDRVEASLDVDSLVSLGEDACGRILTVEIGGRVSRVEDAKPSGCAAGVPGAPTGTPTAIASIKAARRQRALLRGGLLLRVHCARACGFRALARLSLKRNGRPRRLRGVVRRLSAGASVRVKLTLSKGGRRAVRRALRRGKRVTATAFVRVREPGGTPSTTRRVIRLVG